MAGAHKNGGYDSATIEEIIKTPTMKSRQRFFCIISPLQILHFTDVTIRETTYDETVNHNYSHQ